MSKPSTINIKCVEYCTMLPDTEHGYCVEIIARRTLHGPAFVLRFPFDAYCHKIQERLVAIASREKENAALRVRMLTGEDDIPF